MTPSLITLIYFSRFLEVILRTINKIQKDKKKSKSLRKTQKFQITHVDVLEEGDLGSGGDELEGETPSTHRGTHVPPSDLWRLGHCTGRMVSTRREFFVC